MTFKFTEFVVEEACLQYFEQLKHAYLPAPEIACNGLFAERTDLPARQAGEGDPDSAPAGGTGCGMKTFV